MAKPFTARSLSASRPNEQAKWKVNCAPTVYRAIEFLVEQGLAHRIHSLNAFIGCPFPNSVHSNVFMICEQCNNVAEMADAKINQLITDRSEKLNFTLRSQSIELFGICPKCSNGDSHA